MMRLLVAFLVIGVLACGGGDGGSGDEGGEAAAAVAALGTASINGVVTFDGTPPP
jgi:hypothetical protein